MLIGGLSIQNLAGLAVDFEFDHSAAGHENLDLPRVIVVFDFDRHSARGQSSDLGGFGKANTRTLRSNGNECGNQRNHAPCQPCRGCKRSALGQTTRENQRYSEVMPEEFEDDSEGLERPPSFFPYDEEEEQDASTLGEPVKVTVEGVYAAESNGSVQRFVLLVDGERKVPILIGPFEAQAISLPLEGNTPDRPMTHDLFRTVIERFEGTLERVLIDDLWRTTYYAKLYIRHGDEEMEIDSRPSDAIALAVRFDAPIYVSEGIFEQNASDF